MHGESDAAAPYGRDTPLLLRPWMEADAEGLRAAIDEDVSHLKPWLSWTLEEPASLACTRARLLRWVEHFRSGRASRYAIVPLDRPSLILGGAHLGRRVGPEAHDVGYWVRGSAARRGIAAAAVSRLVCHAFEQTAVRRLVIQCDAANTRSVAFARALGFEAIGAATLANPDGSPRPVLRYEMTRESFRLHHAPALRQRARRARLRMNER